MGIETKRTAILTALGQQKADLVIKNAQIVNVFTKEIVQGDIAICNNTVAGIGSYEGLNEIDASGKYVCPGLIDSHVHIESSMVSPAEFAKAILPHGTTTIIADPHEIANVCGVNGIHFMLNQSRELPMNVYMMVPSCVPATPFEDNGAALDHETMRPLVTVDRILGLGEVMDYPSVLKADEALLKKIELFDSMAVDGHSPSLRGKELNAYRAAGILTDHECSTLEEALDRLRLGMYVQIREGSAARNLEDIIRGLLKNGTGFDRCVFCTDDKHLENIRKEGHISANIRKAIALGVNYIDAICMATINAAQCYRLKGLGAVAPGYFADLILLNDIHSFDVHSVYYHGQQVMGPGKSIAIEYKIDDCNVFNTVRIPNITSDELTIRLEKETAATIHLISHELVTKKEKAAVRVENGLFTADGNFSKLAVIERHKALNNIGLGIVSRFNIKNGAIASTVAHDSHNLIVIGDNDADMLLAIQEIKRVNGGYTIVSNGSVLKTLELPIAGLMSDRTADYVETKLASMLEYAFKLGVNPDIDPFVTLSFLALPVIPELRVTDRGLFDVSAFDFIKIQQPEQ